MRDEDKPFVLYRHGWSTRIIPRNAAGWRGFSLWMLGLAALVATFIYALSLANSGLAIASIAGAYALGLIVWSVAMVRWMKARAEIVDIAELLKLKRAHGSRKTYDKN